MAKRVPWVVITAKGPFCERCRTLEQSPATPLPVAAFLAYGRFLLEKHRYCQVRAGDNAPDPRITVQPTPEQEHP